MHSAASYALVILCIFSLISINYALTREEARKFDSHAIPVIPGSDVHGSVSVGTNKDDTHTFKSNGIPDHGLGQLAKRDNKYNIEEQSFRMRFPENPTLNENVTCIEANSIIGFATNGVPIFSPFDENSKNVNLYLDGKTCQGRTNEDGIYHYTQTPDKCSTFTKGYLKHDPHSIYGVAIDGFPIYGPGLGEITNADLDACHGKEVDGQYRYYMTDEWPYVLGCFRGTPGKVYGAPKATGICKFACNKRAKSDDVKCEDDFPVIHEEL